MTSTPVLFVSHGAPTLLLETRSPTYAFLSQLARDLPRPKAVLAVSAHWATAQPMVSAAAAPQTIHDFSGFPEELYRLRYEPPGAPAVAARVVELLTAGGMPASAHPTRGLDHGAWAPMRLIWPDADIPTLQLSVQPRENAAHHLALGHLLRPLSDEGVLLLASGSATHNLGALDWDGGVPGAAPPAWSAAFADWLSERIEAGDADALVNWLKTGPSARMAHPTDEHYLPLLVALGAAGEGARGETLHAAYTYGSLAMHAYRFQRR
jgi:4,5-DOPA dioxygenase extradiol